MKKKENSCSETPWKHQCLRPPSTGWLHLQFPLISREQPLELPPVSRQYPLMGFSRGCSQKQYDISGGRDQITSLYSTCSIFMQDLALVRGKSILHIFTTLISGIYDLLYLAPKYS